MRVSAALASLAAVATVTRAVPDNDDDLHFWLHARGQNKDRSTPLYKDPNASIEDRINDLLPRMTLEEKVSQL